MGDKLITIMLQESELDAVRHCMARAMLYCGTDDQLAADVLARLTAAKEEATAAEKSQK
jgi:hypothetical protein